jgi:hypothetical protein
MLSKSLTYQKFIAVVFLAGVLLPSPVYSVPVINAPLSESDRRLTWPTLSQDGFIEEIQFHKKRIELISQLLGGYLGLNSRELISALAKVHDNAKLIPEVTSELYKIYQTEASPKNVTIKKMNDLDLEITLNKLIELGHFDGVSIDTRGLYAMFVVDLADKIDRSMYPKVLARELYHVSNVRVNSPEFARPMKLIKDYLDFDTYAGQYYFPDLEKLHKAVDFAEKNYRIWVRNNRLIPVSMYSGSCENLLR